MDRQDLFDALTVRLAEGTRRQDAVRLLGKLGVALALAGAAPGRVVAGEVGTESAVVKGCRLPGQKCNNNKDCCSRKCTGKKRCGCVKKGGKPLVKTPLGPVPVKALCCTNKLNQRSGECR